MHRVILSLSVLFLACGPKEEDYVTVSEADADADADTDTDADSDADTDTDPVYFEPAAVGFELYGGWNAETGDLIPYSLDEGKTLYSPFVLLSFANIDYFSATSADDQAANDCLVYATFTYANADVQAYLYDDPDGGSLGTWSGWEGSVEFDEGAFEADDIEGNCTNWDPAIYPGGGPIETFSGMHLGIAYGGFTDYLAEAWTETTIEDYGDFMFTQFIAVNHPDGAGGYDFKAYDWTTGFMWEMDTDNGNVSIDDKGNLTGASDFDVGGFTYGAAYWFEDFPNLDMSLLKEGVP